jgi:predicted metalloprotease
MELDNQRESENVEDRRGIGVGAGSLGIGGLVIVVIAAFLGYDPSDVMNVVQDVQQASPSPDTSKAPRGAPGDAMGHFVSRVLGSTEDVWGEIFATAGHEYRRPTLVLFTGSTATSCGMGAAAMGPFYCPGDEKVYIDLAFYNDLRQRFHAPGDFAQAYVIAHEVGHHVQKLTGISQKVDAARGRVSKEEANRLSVRMELQADCYAGVWGSHAQAKGQLDPGDVDQALAAATAIGDDRLQKAAQGYVVPESFTHGTSEQRVRWFKRGMGSGRVKDCDTFGAASL